MMHKKTPLRLVSNFRGAVQLSAGLLHQESSESEWSSKCVVHAANIVHGINVILESIFRITPSTEKFEIFLVASAVVVIEINAAVIVIVPVKEIVVLRLIIFEEFVAPFDESDSTG